MKHQVRKDVWGSMVDSDRLCRYYMDGSQGNSANVRSGRHRSLSLLLW